MDKILDKERQKFYSLWHSYHAKYKIPYSHDEKETIFNSITEIFLENTRVENRNKMIKYLQVEHKARGEEILTLKESLAKRSAQIGDLKNKLIKQHEISSRLADKLADIKYMANIHGEYKNAEEQLTALMNKINE